MLSLDIAALIEANSLFVMHQVLVQLMNFLLQLCGWLVYFFRNNNLVLLAEVVAHEVLNLLEVFSSVLIVFLSPLQTLILVLNEAVLKFLHMLDSPIAKILSILVIDVTKRKLRECDTIVIAFKLT